MKQVLQDMRSGKTRVDDVPPPQPGRGQVLVATRASLISAGTEKMLMDFAKKSLLGKAQERPDLVKKVMEKLQRDGVMATINSVFSRLEEPLPLGYSAAGEVLAVSTDLANLYKPGDRVVMAGAGYANHAEINAVPKNLVAALPEGVSYEHGCFATVTAIAMQGFRNTKAGLGDTVLVMGLGLVGQLTAQLAHAAGCRVFALDYNSHRCDIARETGIQTHVLGQGMPDALLRAFTADKGFDAVIICAATDSNEPLESAAKWARDRSTVVMTGKVGTQVPYGDFMKKELNLIISRSYGPGRYDEAYEKYGNNYPIGFVRWTERDNLAEAARLMASGQLNIEPLITHQFPIEDALAAYALLEERSVPSLGVVLSYPRSAEEALSPRVSLPQPAEPQAYSGKLGIALLGAGAFSTSVLLPQMKKLPDVRFTGIVTKSGTKAAQAGKKFNFAYASANVDEVWQDAETHAVVIATRHDTHARFVQEALSAGKHVFVEKPLALTLDELEQVSTVWQQSGKWLMVGFNRRFSPAVQALTEQFADIATPRQVLIRVNAGRLDDGNWQHNADEGGGRLLGEGCHFVDLALCLLGSPVQRVWACRGQGQDVFAITLQTVDGSTAQIMYSSEGDTSFSKEYIEMYGGGMVGVINNFQSAYLSRNGRTQKLWKGAQDKGHAAELLSFVQAIRGEPTNWRSDTFITSMRATLMAAQSITSNQPEAIAN